MLFLQIKSKVMVRRMNYVTSAKKLFIALRPCRPLYNGWHTGRAAVMGEAAAAVIGWMILGLR
jgi:hypothetical protein